jgi:hypothetical protein
MSHKVSLNRIIGNVVGNLDLSNVNESIEDFARWAAEGVTKIGSRNSYHRYECELEIKNYKASLPPNFAYPLGVKYKNKHLSITKRTFRDFSKGRPANFPPKQNVENGQKVTDVPGVPMALRIAFTGVFTPGEVINITITSNDCGNVNLDTYTHIVVIGDTPASIASAFNDMFNAVHNLPFTSNLNGDNVDLTAKTPEIVLNITIAEDSVSGTVMHSTIQKRVAPRKNTVDLKGNSKHPRTTSENLADRDVTRLNTGINSMNRVSGGYYGFHHEFHPNEEVFSIDNGCINFNTLDGELIGIAYMGIDLDEEGWPLIYWEHEDAVTHYLQYMLISRRYWNGKVPQHVYREAKDRWTELCAQARGDDELPDADELEYLANMWNQLMPLPNKNIF